MKIGIESYKLIVGYVGTDNVREGEGLVLPASDLCYFFLAKRASPARPRTLGFSDGLEFDIRSPFYSGWQASVRSLNKSNLNPLFRDK